MSTPNTSALTLYSTLPLTGAQENANKTQIVNWLVDGTADLTVLSITTMVNLTPLTTAQIAALTTMKLGSFVMNSDTKRPNFYDGNTWQAL